MYYAYSSLGPTATARQRSSSPGSYYEVDEEANELNENSLSSLASLSTSSYILESILLHLPGEDIRRPAALDEEQQ